MQETLTFEAMPQAILVLMHKGDSLRADIGELKKHCQPPQVSEPMIGIDEACKIDRLCAHSGAKNSYLNPKSRRG